MFPSFAPSSVTTTPAGGDPVIGRLEVPANSFAGGRKDPSDSCGWDWLPRFLDGMVPLTRIWGLLTAIVLGGVGVDLAFHRHRTGYYLIGGSVFILIAEVTWVVTLFLQICVRNDSNVWRCWSVVIWFSDWKKSIIYAPMGAVPLIWPHKLWLSYVAGAQLLTLAFLHFIISFRGSKRKKKRKSRLLHAEADSCESSKFEEITDCLDDGLPEPIPGSSHSISDSLLEQADTVLEI